MKKTGLSLSLPSHTGDKTMRNYILARNNIVEIPTGNISGRRDARSFGTVSANLAHYGYVLSSAAYGSLFKLDESALAQWWMDIEPVLKKITGDDKEMGDHVVYKNFPQEVLDMSEGEYWLKQIFMYVGFPNDWFTEEEVEREPALDKIKPKVLHLASNNSLRNIFSSIAKLPAKWTAEQYKFFEYLVTNENLPLDVSIIPFKENMVRIVSAVINSGVEVNMRSATDVIRLATALSDGDVSLKTNTKFINFSRKERRFLLNMLENSTNLQEDMARNKGKWKKFIHNLHPGDYAGRFPAVAAAYDALYHNKVETFNAKVESMVGKYPDSGVIKVLQARPGEYMRRLAQLIYLFEDEAAEGFIAVADKLTVSQLLKIQKYLVTVNDRQHRTFAPRGNWSKLQIVENNRKIPERIRERLLTELDSTLKAKLADKLNYKIYLDKSAELIKLQTSDSELINYGRGTVFPIPANIKFVRSASYWQTSSGSFNIWYDNGWNFFDKDWKEESYCCWTNTTEHNKAAAFSGDPTNSKTADGKACQMIDLYLDKLADAGVRYAVWNILCYSRQSFAEADEVFAALQWGESPQKGELFEPSRCQLSFPLEGNSMTKYIAYIDLETRELVYMDANLRGNVSGAGHNTSILEEQMPAYVEYLASLPTVHDLFKNAKQSTEGAVVSYDDNGYDLVGDKPAYIFRPVNKNSSYTPIDLSALQS
jgi:hypothetical protein